MQCGQKNLNFFQVNCRNIVNKRRALNEIVRELPENTIFCFTKIWLTSDNHDDFYNPKKDQCVCVLDLTERKRAFQKRGEV